MLKIDTDKMWILMTRGDTEDIVFGAVNKEGDPFHPTQKDRLIFSAAKKFGEEPLIAIMNEMSTSEDAFWKIRIEPEDTRELKFGNYPFDVQLEIRDSETGELQRVDTIIGKTDNLEPTLVILGEVSKESE